MKTYAIDSGDGNELATGIEAHLAHRTAQRLADERDESVSLYVIAGGSLDEVESEEIEPTEIEISLTGPLGPRVTYGAQNTETVEAEVPVGWTVDWSNAVSLTPSGTHLIRWAAPLVRSEPDVDRWFTPGRCSGQIVLRSYGCTPEGIAWERTEDRSDRSVTYREMGTAGEDWDPANDVLDVE